MLTDSSSPLCSCQIKTVSECEIRFLLAFLARNHLKCGDIGWCHSIQRFRKCGIKSQRRNYRETITSIDHCSKTNFHILVIKRIRARIRIKKKNSNDIQMMWCKEQGITWPAVNGVVFGLSNEKSKVRRMNIQNDNKLQCFFRLIFYPLYKIRIWVDFLNEIIVAKFYGQWLRKSMICHHFDT